METDEEGEVAGAERIRSFRSNWADFSCLLSLLPSASSLRVRMRDAPADSDTRSGSRAPAKSLATANDYRVSHVALLSLVLRRIKSVGASKRSLQS